MRFLRRLFSLCASYLQRVRRGTPAKGEPEEPPFPRELAPSELVARFVYSKSHIRKAQARPKPGAFNPSPHLELSVVHSSGLSDAEVWEIGRQTLSTDPGRDKIYARADIPVQCLRDVKLRALRDDNPFKRHTSVLDWPLGSDGNETKELWKQICLELSEDLRIELELTSSPVDHS